MSDLELTMMRRVGELNKDLANLKTEADRLKAEVENSKRINTDLLALSNRQASDIRRLTKAGDAMQDALKIQVWPWASQFKSIQQWNAAKEGKGQP
jgi:SMC interacting uncharacterized protein involved in chromosome segregation